MLQWSFTFPKILGKMKKIFRWPKFFLTIFETKIYFLREAKFFISEIEFYLNFVRLWRINCLCRLPKPKFRSHWAIFVALVAIPFPAQFNKKILKSSILKELKWIVWHKIFNKMKLFLQIPWATLFQYNFDFFKDFTDFGMNGDKCVILLFREYTKNAENRGYNWFSSNSTRTNKMFIFVSRNRFTFKGKKNRGLMNFFWSWMG